MAGLAVGLLVNLIVLSVLFAQLGAVRDQIEQSQKATVAEHDRRRREATIDFYLATMRRRRELPDYLAEDRDGEAVARLVKEICRLGIDSDKGHAVREYLNLWEALAVGVETGVYEIEIVDALTGARMVAIAKNYRPFIEWRCREIQQVGDEDEVYRRLEHVAERIRRAREHRSGDITMATSPEGRA